MTDGSAIRVGALVPLSRPGWVEAGRQLLAGLELAAREHSIELVVRDTAGDPERAAAAADELSRLGVVALAGEYHSVVARAVAARADALGVPFLCSSAVLDELTEQPTDWVARIAPAQSHGWRIFADVLLGLGHRRVAVMAEPSVYWAAGTRILREHLSARGGRLAESGATAVLVLAGHPEPTASFVKALRADPGVLIGAPAGQPELAAWMTDIPFLRYRPERLGPLGARVEAVAPSFVALEGYDTIAVLAELVRRHGRDRARIAEGFASVAVAGTRGQIRFSRQPGIGVWQWAWPPVQVVARDPADPARFRALGASGGVGGRRGAARPGLEPARALEHGDPLSE